MFHVDFGSGPGVIPDETRKAALARWLRVNCLDDIQQNIASYCTDI